MKAILLQRQNVSFLVKNSLLEKYLQKEHAYTDWVDGTFIHSKNGKI